MRYRLAVILVLLSAGLAFAACDGSQQCGFAGACIEIINPPPSIVQSGQSVTFSWKLTSPSVPDNQRQVQNSVTAGTCSPANNGPPIFVTADGWATGGCSWTATGTGTQTYTANYFESGAFAVSTCLDVVVNRPPSIYITDKTAIAGSSTTITAQGSDPDGDSLTYTWKVDGSTVAFQTSNTLTYSFSATRHTVEVTASDGKGGSDTDAGVVCAYDATAAVTTDAGWVQKYGDSPENEYKLMLRDCYSETNGKQAYYAAGVGVVKSVDGGNTWAAGAALPNNQGQPQTVLFQDHNGYIYTGNSPQTATSNIWRSTSVRSVSAWNQLSGGPIGVDVLLSNFIQGDDGNLYIISGIAGTSNSWNVWRLNPSSLAWTKLNSGSVSGQVTTVLAKGNAGEFYSVGLYKPDLNTDSYVFSRSIDNGVTWSVLGTIKSLSASGSVRTPILARSNGELWVGMDDGNSFFTGGLFRSTNGGSTWTQLSTPFTTVYAVAEGPDGTVFVSAKGGGVVNVFMTANSGSSWTVVGTSGSLGAVNAKALASSGFPISSTDKPWLVVGTNPDRIWRYAVNDPPQANAGSDKTVPPNTAFTQDGSATVDPETPDSGLTFSWNWGDGSPVETGLGTTHVSRTHTYTTTGTKTITLTVTDPQGLSSTDTAVINVVAQTPPVCDAGGPYIGYAGRPLAFDASRTTDAESCPSGGTGCPLTYSWNWGDATAAGSGVQPSHTYAVEGRYNVTLTVTDSTPLSCQRSVLAEVLRPLAAPVALFTANPSSGAATVTTSFDASSSFDPDGSIANYEWDFDSNGVIDASSTSPTTSYSYTSPGVYTVTLNVTDNSNLKATTTGEVRVFTTASKPNLVVFSRFVWFSGIPRVNYTVQASALVLNNGPLASPTFNVTFYDGVPSDSTAFGQVTVSTLASGASTRVYAPWSPLTPGLHYIYVVADPPYAGKPNGDVDETSEVDNTGVRPITVYVGPPCSPAASFTATPASGAAPPTQAVNFASTSTDSPAPPCSIVNYDWTFGNGASQTGTAATATGSYAAPGLYGVRLGVTDNVGAFSSAFKLVPIVHTDPCLGDLALTSESISVSNPSPNPGNPITITVTVGNTGTSTDAGTVTLSWRSSTGAATVIGSQSVNVASGSTQSVTFNWNYVAGAVDLLASVLADVDCDLSNNQAVKAFVRPPQPPPVNKPPVARFTINPFAATPGQSVTFDGTSSSDPDGSIASWDWSFSKFSWVLFGGQLEPPASGSTVSRSFASPGLYAAFLRVTDNGVPAPAMSNWASQYFIVKDTTCVGSRLGIADVKITPASVQYNDAVLVTVWASNIGPAAATATVTLEALDASGVLLSEGQPSPNTVSGSVPGNSITQLSPQVSWQVPANASTLRLTLVPPPGDCDSSTKFAASSLSVRSPPRAVIDCPPFTYGPRGKYGGSSGISQPSFNCYSDRSSDLDGFIADKKWSMFKDFARGDARAKPQAVNALADGSVKLEGLNGNYYLYLAVTDNNGLSDEDWVFLPIGESAVVGEAHPGIESLTFDPNPAFKDKKITLTAKVKNYGAAAFQPDTSICGTIPVSRCALAVVFRKTGFVAAASILPLASAAAPPGPVILTLPGDVIVPLSTTLSASGVEDVQYVFDGSPTSLGTYSFKAFLGIVDTSSPSSAQAFNDVQSDVTKCPGAQYSRGVPSPNPQNDCSNDNTIDASITVTQAQFVQVAGDEIPFEALLALLIVVPAIAYSLASRPRRKK